MMLLVWRVSFWLKLSGLCLRVSNALLAVAERIRFVAQHLNDTAESCTARARKHLNDR